MVTSKLKLSQKYVHLLKSQTARKDGEKYLMTLDGVYDKNVNKTKSGGLKSLGSTGFKILFLNKR